MLSEIYLLVSWPNILKLNQTVIVENYICPQLLADKLVVIIIMKFVIGTKRYWYLSINL